MPLSEYKCRRCGQKVEFLERDFNATHHICPRCGGKDLQKLVSVFSAGRSDSGMEGGGLLSDGDAFAGIDRKA